MDSTPRVRIKDMKLIRGSELIGHDNNPRIHPLYQREALNGSIDQDGITDVLRAYPSARNGGKLTLINGHMRTDEHPDIHWPVVILDLDDEEADRQLLVSDAISSWAQMDPLKVDVLVTRAKAANAQMSQTIERIRLSVAPHIEMAKTLLNDGGQDSEGRPRNRYDAVGEKRGKSVKVVIDIGDDLAVVERALRQTGLKGRGESLVKICQSYLDNLDTTKR